MRQDLNHVLAKPISDIKLSAVLCGYGTKTAGKSEKLPQNTLELDSFPFMSNLRLQIICPLPFLRLSSNPNIMPSNYLSSRICSCLEYIFFHPSISGTMGHFCEFSIDPTNSHVEQVVPRPLLPKNRFITRMRSNHIPHSADRGKKYNQHGTHGKSPVSSSYWLKVESDEKDSARGASLQTN